MREQANWNLPSMLENSELLAYFSRVFAPRLLCVVHDIESHRHRVSLVPQSPVQDAASYELSSMLDACFPLFSSLRRETLPSSSSIHRQLSFMSFVVTTSTIRALGADSELGVVFYSACCWSCVRHFGTFRVFRYT